MCEEPGISNTTEDEDSCTQVECYHNKYMEKCGICAYVTHEFAVFPEVKPEGENWQMSGLPRRIFHAFPWCN